MDYIVTMCLTMMLDSKGNDCTFLPKKNSVSFITKIFRHFLIYNFHLLKYNRLCYKVKDFKDFVKHVPLVSFS